MAEYTPNPSPDQSQTGPNLADGDRVGPFVTSGGSWAFLTVTTTGVYRVAIDTTRTPRGDKPMFVLINPDLKTQPSGASGAQQEYPEVTLVGGTRYNVLFQIEDPASSYRQTLTLKAAGAPAPEPAQLIDKDFVVVRRPALVALPDGTPATGLAEGTTALVDGKFRRVSGGAFTPITLT